MKSNAMFFTFFPSEPIIFHLFYLASTSPGTVAEAHAEAAAAPLLRTPQAFGTCLRRRGDGQVFFLSVATPGVLRVGVKAGCSFEVVSSVSGKFGDHYNTPAPSSSFLTKVSHKTFSRRPLANPLVTLGPLRSLFLWCSANFAIARATLSSLWASRCCGALRQASR